MRQLASEVPIHPNYLAHIASRVLPEDTVVVSENFRAADHLMPFGFNKGQWRLIRTFGGSLGYGIGAAIGAQLARSGPAGGVQPGRRRRDVRLVRVLDHGALQPAHSHHRVEQSQLPDRAHQFCRLGWGNGQTK